MSSLTVEQDQKWVPTHVQVTVLRGRGLRAKGKHGTSDAYAIIQLGKEKYSTGVVERSTEPEWKEECTFELGSGCPAGGDELVLTVMHRAPIGMDVFLGQALLQLEKIFHESRGVKNEWFRLNSKTGKKEKERGDIQLSIQFTRNNLTASMYDLVMKDKGASTFGKLKERMRGKRRSSNEDSSSAILPGGYGSLCRMRQRLPSDGGGEEDYEDDEGGEVRRSKMRTFFLRGKLRKSSDTRSSTSLGSESSESSSRGGSLSPTAGISVVVSDLSNSPSNSSNLTTDNSPEHTENMSPKSSSSLKCEFGDDDGEVTIVVPQPAVCINGSHPHGVQPLDPGSGTPPRSLGLGMLQKSLPLSVSLQNLSTRASTGLPTGHVGDGRRWSIDKPDEKEKAAIAAVLDQSGPLLANEEDDDGRLGQADPTKASTAEKESPGKKQKRSLFSSGRGDSVGKRQSQSRDEPEQASSATEEKHKGRFGFKDSKPSLVVSPKLDPSTHSHHPPLPPSYLPSGPPVHPTSVVSPLYHTNPFCHSQSTPSPISPCNPFFSLLQHNPFYEDMLTTQPLKPSLPPLPYLSSSRPPIAHLFPQMSNPNPAHDYPVTANGGMAKVGKRPLPPTPTERETRLNRRASNPFLSVGALEPDSEWDDSFEAFAAGRLQPPEDPTTDCKTQQNMTSDNPLEHCNNKGALLPTKHDPPHQQTCAEFGLEARKATNQLTNFNTYHFDAIAQFLETIPEHTSFEGDNLTLNTPANAPKLAAFTENNKADIKTNTNYLTNTNTDQVPHGTHTPSSVKLNSSSPDPGSSGIGSSVEEDFLSCLSSYSDKFSASSSEEAEAQNFESDLLSFEKSSESAEEKKLSESEDDVTDRSNDLTLVDKDQHTVILNNDVKLDANALALDSSAPTHQQPEITTRETPAQKLQELQPKSNGPLQCDKENGGGEIGEFNRRLEDFPKVSNDSSLSVSNPMDLMIPSSPDDECCSTHPSIHIITSSPDVRKSLSDMPTERIPLGSQNPSSHSPISFQHFGDFLNASRIANSPSQSFDDMLLHSRVSDQSTSSFLQSLYVSTDSQNYQTCESHASSNCSRGSEPEETLHSANSTLCGELGKTQTTAGDGWGQVDLSNARAPSNEEVNQTVRCEPVDNSPTLQLSITGGDDFRMEELLAPSTDSYMCCGPSKLTEEDAESPHIVLDDVLSKCLQAQTLHRSHSEGTLMPVFDELLLPSFGSDPGAIQVESSSADLPSLTSFVPPPLTPDRSRSPVALSSFPPSANATARSPPSTARAVAPNPMPQESQQQQAANQRNSPHAVKPLATTLPADEKRTEGRSVLATRLEKLKSTIHPGRSSMLSEQETDRRKSWTEGAGSYYHLNQSELVDLLVQREAELERQREEFEQQKCLLAKREVELKKLKPQVRDLEDYIDTLLVRIMEQKPTLLQVRSKLK